MHRHRHLWELPLFVFLWVLAGIAWILVWSILWCWETYAVATVKAARNASRIFGWIE